MRQPVEEITLEEFRQLRASGGAGANKYGAKRQPVDVLDRKGRPRWADSTVEAERWGELRTLERAGEIRDLLFHPVYVLLDARPGWPAVRYEADSSYVEARTGARVVEDVKGGRATVTEAFKLKARLLVERYPDVTFRIEER